MNDKLMGSGMITLMNSAKARMMACQVARRYLWEKNTDASDDFYTMDKKLEVKESYYRGQLDGLTILCQRLDEEMPVLTNEFDRLLYNRLADKIDLLTEMKVKSN